MGIDLNDDAAATVARAEKRPRINVEVPLSVNESVARLTAQLDITKTELLRRAITLMELAVCEIGKGNQLTVADKDMKVVTRIIGIW